ncbi:MAG: YjgN family protein, partial [Rhodanobacteraceae bacterium]
AKPWPILKGRLIAVVLFGGYVLAGQFSIGLQLGLAAVIALLTPWLIVRGAAFRARYSSWRGLNFRFVPDYGEAYVRYLLLGVPMLLTFGLLYPYVKAKQKAFFVEHHRYGGCWFSFRATPGQFYPPYLIAWAVIVAWMFVFSIAVGMLGAFFGGSGNGMPPVWFFYLFVIPIYGGYFVVWAFLAAALANLVYNHTDLGRHRFRSTLKGHYLLGIYASNTVAILVSAGLLIPWAKVRLARYRAQTFTLLAADDLEGFRAESHAEVGAAAAEVDGFFDIDIGL